MDARPQKRNRTSSSHERPGESAPTLSSVGLKRSEEFWLQDGNLVLVAGNIAFRVYRGLLAAQSEVFEGLFASATPATGEMFQGCPVIHLSDSPEDLVRLLRVLLPMTNKADESQDFTSFEHIFASVRLAHKYQIKAIERGGLMQLKGYFNCSIERFIEHRSGKNDPFMSTCHPIGVINLARLTDTPALLPAAFYLTCQMGGKILEGWKREDGTVEYLSEGDLRLCMDGLVRLGGDLAHLRFLNSRVLPNDQCTRREICQREMKRMQNYIYCHGIDALRDWKSILRTYDCVACDGCTEALLKSATDGRRTIWYMLPSIFKVPEEGWGFS